MSSTNLPTDSQSPKYGSASLNENDDLELQELLEPDLPPEDDHELEDSESVPTQESAVSSNVIRRLYISHFLSTWNSRVFEFGAVLFIAKIFPGTLLPVSIYAVVRSASAIVLSPKVGNYIDLSDRLKVVRISIGKSTQEVPCENVWL
jgi:Ferroportin1 (FPN1)